MRQTCPWLLIRYGPHNMNKKRTRYTQGTHKCVSYRQITAEHWTPSASFSVLHTSDSGPYVWRGEVFWGRGILGGGGGGGGEGFLILYGTY